jgi:hypothetical protein
MKCSICKIEGHNKRSCKKIVVDVENKDVENELKVTRKKIYKKVVDNKELKSESDIIKFFFRRKNCDMENNKKDTKITCSLCKEEGHNKRSCNTKKLAIPVSSQKTETKTKIISKEDAEKSADEWVGSGQSPMRTWLVNAIMDPMQHRDIGKVLAYVVEDYVNKWLSQKSGRPIKNVVGESYDGKTDDTMPVVRNQIKFRMDAWHFETTRRNSQKNKETNETGHVAYKKDEFDILAIFKPSSTFGITGSTIRCIPVSALVNPKKPDQLITSINANIRKVYDCDEKTDEVIKLLYQRHSSPQD